MAYIKLTLGHADSEILHCDGYYRATLSYFEGPNIDLNASSDRVLECITRDVRKNLS